MLSSELEYCLNDAFQRARDHRHEFMTVEHLLLALLDIPKVHEILKACDSNISGRRRSCRTMMIRMYSQRLDFNAYCNAQSSMCSRAARKK
jgi:ATP-dependent Clp protease ATP-binding subunit ClpA